MARTSRTVPRIGRIGSLVPSALIFWITVIILGECQLGVQGDCQINCVDNSYCIQTLCSRGCITPDFDESIEVGTVLFTVVTVPPGSEIRITMVTENADSVFRVNGSDVLLNSSFDYESVKEYLFDIDCRDGDWSETPESLDHQLKVEDVNDNEPYFKVTTIYANILENAETGTVLITDVKIQAFDDDEIEEAFIYSIQEDVPFKVIDDTADECQSGEVFLSLNEAIDFEDQEFYNFTLIVEDGCTSGSDSREGNVNVIVQVIDTDDEPPVFSQDNYDVTIPERDSTFVYAGLSASDGDSLNAPLRYSFIGQSGEWGCLYFLEIDPVTADVTIRNELDFETSPGTCLITVQAVQQNDSNMVGTTALNVDVMNVEECPSFISQSYSGQLTENDPFVITDGGSERLIMGMTDEDSVFNGPSYIEPNDTIELVEMTKPEGTRTRSFLIKFLDLASIESDTKVQIFLNDDTADMECDSTITNVTVRLMPDGLAPNFTRSYYYGNVPENATVGTSIIQVEALNLEMTSDGIVYRLQMASDGGEDVFSVDAESGVVSVVMEDGLDAEKVKQYTLIIEAVDERGTYYRSSITSVIIDVTDVNDHDPTFAVFVREVDIEEEVPTNSLVYTVQANDLDVDAILEFSIRENAVPFKIDPETGEISTDGRLDRDEGTTAYNITVVVTDGTNEDDRLVTITLIDINDNAPEFTGGSQELSVSENATDTEMLQVIEATDIDEGVNAEIVYVLESPDDGLFSVDNETGMLYANGPFDYEAVKEYALVISASDSKFLTLTTVTVTITDVNDNAPVFISFCLNIEVLEDVGDDHVICTIEAVDDDDDGKDLVTYSLDLSSGDVPFSVDPSGDIRTDGMLDRETEDNYIITIIAEDSGEPPLSSNTTITVIVLDVNDNEPVFVETSPPVRLQKDDLADPPFLLSRVKATDADLAPWDITNCEKTSGEDSFVVLTGQDGSCEIYAYEELPIGSYSVYFYAFNPDNRELQSENVTLTVDIRDTVCDVTFENEADYDVIVLESELETNVPVVTLNVTSNCNSDDIVFNISSQTYRPDLDASPLPSINFTINDQTGEIFPTDIVMEGKYILLVRAYNQSDPEVSETTEVTIVVTGENTAPAFEEPFYTADITEDSMTMVIDLGPEVTDVDTPSFANGELSFSKVSETDGSGSSSDYFEVSSSGIVTTTQANLNLIKSGTFQVDVMVMDGAIEPLSNTTVVIINVDIDDQSNPVVSPPMITKDCPDQVEIEEFKETAFPVHICNVSGSSAYDDQVVFGLESASESFDIGTDSGEITTTKTFDYETDERSYTLLVYAEGTTSKLRNYTSFTVIVTDINDNAPVFSESPYSFSMEENARGSEECLTFVGLIQSTDVDSKINQFVTYTTDDDDFEVRGNDLMAVNCISRNSVKYATGEVVVTITALNNGTNATLTTDVDVTIEVVDINDHAPEFVNEDFSVSLEDLSTVRVIFQGDVNDMDEGPFNNEVVFSLADDQDGVIYSLFHMSSDGNLTVQDIGISDEYLMYEVIIMATDMGQPPLSSSRTVTVYIGIVDVTEPYFRPSERNQPIVIKENDPDYCHDFFHPQTCNETLEVDYDLEVEPESGKDLFSIIETENALSLCSKELDREVSSSYTVTLTACYGYEAKGVCNSINVTTCSDPTRKRRDVQVPTNTIIFTIIVMDDADSPPSFLFPSNTNGTAYYLAAIDSTQFGSPVYTVIAEDKDASWEFRYTLTSLSEDGVEGPKNTIVIDPSDGRITTNSLLYPSLSDAWSWEWEKENNFRASRTQDPYNVTVCDTSPTSSNISQCDTTRLTFKILLSFEHIIIRFNKPVATIMPRQNDIISCIARTMDPTNRLEINLQFLSPVKENDQDMTDMWLYAVNSSKLPSSPYLKYEDFETIWGDTEGLKECNGGDEMTATRLQLSKILPGMSTTSAIEAWVPIALGIIVFIGNLICIILLLVSWKTMHLESGRELARQLTVHDEEKGIANPVFEYDDEADDDVEIMATEAEEGATGSEEPLITTVYLTDGKTQSTIAMTANDEPTDVEKAVGTDAVTIPDREYDFEEKEMDFDFEYDDIKTGNDVSEAAATTESSSTDPTIPLPLDKNDEDTKDKDGAKEESEREDPEEESLLSKPKPPAVPPKPTDHANNGSAADPMLPDVDYETETKNRDPVEDEEKATPGTPDSGMETDHEAFKDSDVPPPPPVPIVQESPLEDQVEDHPLPPPPPPLPIVPPIDYADGKTVTFGGETVVGEGAGDGGSTCTDQDTASEASSRSGTAEDRSTRRGPSLSSEIDLIAASLNGDAHSSSGNQHVGLVTSPQSICESEGESIGYLDDESLISVSEIGVTSL